MKLEEIATARTSDLLLAMNLERMKAVIVRERAEANGWPESAGHLGMSVETLEHRAVERLEAIAAEIDRRIPAPAVKP